MIKAFFAAATALFACSWGPSIEQQALKQKGNEVMVMNAPPKTIYEFQVPGIDGKTIDFSDFKGKKILIVNTASKCGYTPQYEALERVSKEYAAKLVVVGFPSDNFGGQEFGKDEETAAFCKKNYGVTFPLAGRSHVIGSEANPVFKYLSQRSENGVLDAKVTWNFCKFLVDENGQVMAFFPSKVAPDSEEILSKIKG